MINNTLNVADIFCGVGGLSYGFYHSSAFKIIFANEILKDMAEAYSLNHKNVIMFNCDIKEINENTLKNSFDIKSNPIDIILGGPPCQAYSTIGKRLMDDPRGKLFQEYYRLVKLLKPKVFLFENVKGLISMNGGSLIDEIIKLFSSLGYNISYKLLNAVNYGIPQIRERLIIIGSLLEKKFIFPEKTHTNQLECSQPQIFPDFKETKPWITLGEALSDLPLIKSGEVSETYLSEPKNPYQEMMRKNSNCKLKDHNSPNHGDKLIEIMDMLKDGESIWDYPKYFQPSSGYGNTYSKLWWNKPATTITRNFGTPSSSRCIHPKVSRGLTTREGARLQSFPDDYIFVGSRTSKNLQIGNAVPPLLSIKLAESIIKYFKDQSSAYLGPPARDFAASGSPVR